MTQCAQHAPVPTTASRRACAVAQVNGGAWVDVGVYTTGQLCDKNLFVACGTYRLAAINAACGAT